MPDEVQRSFGGKFGDSAKPIIKSATHDLALFVYRFPRWVNKAGYPRSWRHFYIGMELLNRERARDWLENFRANAAAQASGKDREELVDTQRKLAGYE